MLDLVPKDSYKKLEQIDLNKPINIEDNIYDAVICSEVLEHLESLDDAVSEIVRVLKPGGVLAVSVPRFIPELICWKLSSEYSKTPGGHVRIFRHKNKLRR